MFPLMLHSLASVAALHPTAPYQQSINVNTTCDSGLSFTHSLPGNPSVGSLVTLVTSVRPAPNRHYSPLVARMSLMPLTRALLAALRPCIYANWYANRAPGSGCCATVLPFADGAVSGQRRSVWRVARSADSIRHVSGISRCSGQRKISGHIEACVVADRCGAEPRWHIRCGNVRTNDGFPLPRISMGLAIPLWL